MPQASSSVARRSKTQQAVLKPVPTNPSLTLPDERNSRVRCRSGYEDWNEKDVCLLLEELAVGTVGHLFRTIYTVEKSLASAMAKSRLMKMIPFARWERGGNSLKCPSGPALFV